MIGGGLQSHYDRRTERSRQKRRFAGRAERIFSPLCSSWSFGGGIFVKPNRRRRGRSFFG